MSTRERRPHPAIPAGLPVPHVELERAADHAPVAIVEQGARPPAMEARKCGRVTPTASDRAYREDEQVGRHQSDGVDGEVAASSDNVAVVLERSLMLVQAGFASLHDVFVRLAATSSAVIRSCAGAHDTSEDAGVVASARALLGRLDAIMEAAVGLADAVIRRGAHAIEGTLASGLEIVIGGLGTTLDDDGVARLSAVIGGLHDVVDGAVTSAAQWMFDAFDAVGGKCREIADKVPSLDDGPGQRDVGRGADEVRRKAAAFADANRPALASEAGAPTWERLAAIAQTLATIVQATLDVVIVVATCGAGAPVGPVAAGLDAAAALIGDGMSQADAAAALVSAQAAGDAASAAASATGAVTDGAAAVGDAVSDGAGAAADAWHHTFG